MTEQPSLSHQDYEELVAAHVLDALEPEAQQQLADHITTCQRCRRELDSFSFVAAQLGSLADEQLPSPAWPQIRPHIISAEQPDLEPLGHPEHRPTRSVAAPRLVAPTHHRAARAGRGRRGQLFAAAAALVMLVGGGVAGWQWATRSARSPEPVALTACQQQNGCRVTKLHTADGSGTGSSAAVIVDARHASLVPLTMTSAPEGRMYVLWQMPRDGSPVPIISFRQTSRQTGTVSLPVTYADTAAFAVSLESAGPLPTRPSDIQTIGASLG